MYTKSSFAKMFVSFRFRWKKTVLFNRTSIPAIIIQVFEDRADLRFGPSSTSKIHGASINATGPIKNLSGFFANTERLHKTSKSTRKNQVSAKMHSQTRFCRKVRPHLVFLQSPLLFVTTKKLHVIIFRSSPKTRVYLKNSPYRTEVE